MTTREQDAFIARWSDEHGRVAVRTGYADKSATVTAPDGSCFKISADGAAVRQMPNFSVDWSYA